MNHERLNDLPEWLRVALTLFNRVGFPVLVSAGLFYMCFMKMDQQMKAITEFKDVLYQMKSSMDTGNEVNKRLIEAIYRTRK